LNAGLGRTPAREAILVIAQYIAMAPSLGLARTTRRKTRRRSSLFVDASDNGEYEANGKATADQPAPE